MHCRTLTCTMLLGLVATTAMGVTLDLSAIADNGGRFVEYRQGAFWELGRTRESTRVDEPDGAFTYSALPNYVPQGGGGTAFPHKQNFLSLGSIEYDEATGDITGMELDFAQHVAPSIFTYFQAASGASAYTTSFNLFSGTVIPNDAGLPVVNLTSEIVFSIESAFDGILKYTGSFNVIDNAFVLDVDDVQHSRYFNTLFPGQGDVRLIWIVTGAVGLMGDFNHDGSVDAADYTLWRDNLGREGAMLTGDANNDQVVDASDYLAWKQNFGRSFNGTDFAATTVPEPASVTLLLTFIAIYAQRVAADRAFVR